jgi:hypothetical protein
MQAQLKTYVYDVNPELLSWLRKNITLADRKPVSNMNIHSFLNSENTH